MENEATSLIKAGHEVGLLSIAPYEESKIISHIRDQSLFKMQI